MIPNDPILVKAFVLGMSAVDRKRSDLVLRAARLMSARAHRLGLLRKEVTR